MTICQLADVNPEGATGAYYYDGVTEVNAPWCGGTDSLCEWWMRLPKFYYHAEEIESDIWDIGFGQEPEADDWKCWDGNDLIGVFKASTDNRGYPVCRANMTPKVNMSQTDFYNKVRLRGDGYSLVKWKHHSMMAFLFYAMYGNTNSQAICGTGSSSSSSSGKTTGATDILGMTDTVAGVNGDIDYINFWGLENWWGWIYEFIDNIYASNSLSEDIYDWSIYEDDGSVRKIRGTSNGIITKIHIGGYLDAGPLETTTNFDTHNYGFCDIFSFGRGMNDVCFGRSYGGSNLNSGIVSLCWWVYDFIHGNLGSRLAFRGDIIVEDDIQAFRSIPVTNIEVNPVCP